MFYKKNRFLFQLYVCYTDCCYQMYFHCSGLVELNIILQVQNIGNNKFTNFFDRKWETYTHNETAACVEYYNVR